MTNDQEKAVDILLIAKRSVGKGWIQNAWRSKDGGRVCMRQALYDAGLTYASAHVHSLVTTEALYPIVGSSGTNWNDEPGRTKQEVLDALQTAAEHWT